MKVTPTSIPSVLIIEPRIFGDTRGFFFESFNQRAFNLATGLDVNFVQDNHQIQQPQGKLVRVVRGSVFDVTVDLRKSSPTFGQWVGVELTEDNHRQLWVPPGCAHGFYVLSDSADFLYKTTDYYAPEFECSLIWNDPTIGIKWPLNTQPIISAKDAQGKKLAAAEAFS